MRERLLVVLTRVVGGAAVALAAGGLASAVRNNLTARRKATAGADASGEAAAAASGARTATGGKAEGGAARAEEAPPPGRAYATPEAAGRGRAHGARRPSPSKIVAVTAAGRVTGLRLLPGRGAPSAPARKPLGAATTQVKTVVLAGKPEMAGVSPGAPPSLPATDRRGCDWGACPLNLTHRTHETRKNCVGGRRLR